MDFVFDKSLEFPVYLRDTRTAEVWEFLNEAELHALETLDDLSDGVFEGFDSKLRLLEIHGRNNSIHVRVTPEDMDSELFKNLVAISVH